MENEEQKDLPKPLADLPLPEKNLPLPEKELSAHSDLASQGQALQNHRQVFKNKFFWGFLIISALIAFLIGGFYLGKNQQTPTSLGSPKPTAQAVDPTADWKTYSGENYSFKYPSDWKLEVVSSGLYLTSPDLKINEDLGRAVEGSTIRLESRVIEETSIDKWFNDYWSKPHGGGTPENKTDEYIDTDTKALRYEFNYEGSIVVTEFIKDGYLYSIDIDFPWVETANTWSKRDLPTYNQILSTFKFTDTSSWKTYTNDDFGFNIKYPSSYVKCSIKNEENLVLLEKSSVCAAGEGYSDIYISVVNKKSDFQTSEFPKCYTVKKEDITIAGIKGVKYSSIKIPNTGSECKTQPVLYSSNLQFENIVLENGGKIYELSTPTNYETKKENYQIISTFKFIN